MLESLAFGAVLPPNSRYGNETYTAEVHHPNTAFLSDHGGGYGMVQIAVFSFLERENGQYAPFLDSNICASRRDLGIWRMGLKANALELGDAMAIPKRWMAQCS